MKEDRTVDGRKIFFWTIVMIVATLYVGCAETVKVTRMKPAAIDMAGYNQIAVAEVTGKNGASIRTDLEYALMASGQFEVLDRSNLGYIMREQALSKSGAVDEGKAVRTGKMAGSAALVFGNVSRRDYRQQRTYDDLYCKDEYKRTYFCGKTTHITGYWNTRVQFKVVDAATGKILTTRNIPISHKQQVSARNAVPAIHWDPGSVSSQLDVQVVQEFMKMIAPYRVVERVKLHKDSKLPELEAGINYSRAGQWDSAIDQFQAACEKADAMPGIEPELRARARYDLGVALGYSGSYEEGIREIEKAMRINNEPEYSYEIQKIKIFKQDAERLRRRGGETAPISGIISVIEAG